MNKKNLLLIGLLSTIVLTGCNSKNLNTNPNECGVTNNCSFTNENQNLVPNTMIISYNGKEVEKHSTKEDCRTIINGNIYDITKAFGNHKGGDDALITICGKDGTAIFNGKHGENNEAKGMLDNLYIGELE